MIFQILGILSAVVFLVCDFPYLTDTIKHKTKPHRVTWGVVFTMNAIIFANQYASGADNSLWAFGAAVVMTGAIFIASLFHGVGGYSKLDLFAIAISIIGIILWVVLDSPVYSILANVVVGGVAIIPTYIKAWKEPASETRIAFLGGMISSALAAISVGKPDWQLLILPIYFAILQAVLVYILYLSPRAKQSGNRQTEKTASA